MVGPFRLVRRRDDRSDRKIGADTGAGFPPGSPRPCVRGFERLGKAPRALWQARRSASAALIAGCMDIKTGKRAFHPVHRPMSNTPLRIAVIGAGIGGLTAALSLRRR